MHFTLTLDVRNSSIHAPFLIEYHQAWTDVLNNLLDQWPWLCPQFLHSDEQAGDDMYCHVPQAFPEQILWLGDVWPDLFPMPTLQPQNEVWPRPALVTRARPQGISDSGTLQPHQVALFFPLIYRIRVEGSVFQREFVFIVVNLEGFGSYLFAHRKESGSRVAGFGDLDGAASGRIFGLEEHVAVNLRSAAVSVISLFANEVRCRVLTRLRSSPGSRQRRQGVLYADGWSESSTMLLLMRVLL